MAIGAVELPTGDGGAVVRLVVAVADCVGGGG